MSYVEISAVMVRQTQTGIADNISITVHEPPLRMFWLEYVEDGGRTHVWDGLTYLDALDAARDWSADEVEVRDRVAATWGHA